MSVPLSKKEAKKLAKTEAELALIASSLGRSDLTGEIHCHTGPSFRGNVFQKLGLFKVIPFVRKGAKSSLEHHHIWRLRKQHATETAWQEFEPAWTFQKTQPEPSVISALWSVYYTDFLIALLLQICSIGMSFSLPLLMPYLVRWFVYSKQLPLWWVFIYVGAIFGAQLVTLLFDFHTSLRCYEIGIRVRAALTTLIYRKSLYSPLDRAQSSGMVVNMISTDAQILLDSLPYFIQGVIAPIQIFVVLGLLSRYLKAFCLISLAIAILAIPITGILAGSLGSSMAMVQRKGDIRLKLVKEFLVAIRIVKYYAWENPFLQNISQSRSAQLSQVRAFLLARAGIASILTNIPIVGIGFTFFGYGWKYEMTFETIFSSLTLLNLLALPFVFLPMFFALSAQYYTAFKRIEFFGLRTEVDPRKISIDDKSETLEEFGQVSAYNQVQENQDRPLGGMYIKDASFAWETLLSIAESRFIDLEAQAAIDEVDISDAKNSADKKRATESLKYTNAEKEHVAGIVRSIQRQIKAGTPMDEVNVDDEEKDCVDAFQLFLDEMDFSEPWKSDSDSSSSEEPKTKMKRNKGPSDHDIMVSDEEIDGNKKKKKMKPFARLRRPETNLSSISFDVRPGKLTMVVGNVGSGKTTLAMAFLGEVHQHGGQVRVFEEFSYSAQEAWILNATIRDNITFGSDFDPARYEDVIRRCALATDLTSFPAGDLTEIGERGVNLSGGQRQRINVARAVYSSAPIVILDDPFSAVDAHVADHMFEHVAKGLRDSGRTVLLITNQLHFVSQADYIGVLQEGAMVEQGTFAELCSKKRSALSLMLSRKDTEVAEEDEKRRSMILRRGSDARRGSDRRRSVDPRRLSVNPRASMAFSSDQRGSVNFSMLDPRTAKRGSVDPRRLSMAFSLLTNDFHMDNDLTLEPIAHYPDPFSTNDLDAQEHLQKEKATPFVLTPENDAENRRKGALIFMEEREKGNIGLPTYWKYVRSGGIGIFLLYLLIIAFRTGCEVFSGLWLSWWADPKNVRNFTKVQYLGGYIGLVLGNAAANTIGAIIFVFFSVSTGRKIHRKYLNSVSKAPVGWFDRTPLGRVLARFSKDMSLVDMELPTIFDQCIHFMFALVGLFASLAAGTPYILIIVAVGVLAFGALTLHYRKTSIQVQRIESLSRAPIYSHFAETLEGAVTIRAFRMAQVFKVANMNKIDVNNVDFLGLKYCAIWFSMTLDTLGAFTVGLSYVSMILVRYYRPESVNIGYIIFALAQTGRVCQCLAAASHMLTDLENKMNSVERIRQYSNLPSEGPFEREDTKPDPSWPAEGNIVLEDLTIEYKKDIPVLHGLNCEFKAKEKIGIVGRTGAGKSTLITALFRTMEPASGRILIDGIDITQIGLTDLRSKLSIIPQTPQLFVGTVRYNLDPFDEHVDADLWRVLKMVKLKNYIGKLENGLLSPVEENGSNFSVGQRQLLSMARCLLRKTHVLLLDEATAALDTETDALVQRMIRENFKDKTVLTIAHRLNTIMDSDRILVLDHGNIAEFDTPENLLKDKNGVFYGMVEATGAETSATLRKMALEKGVKEEAEIIEEIEISPKTKRKGSHTGVRFAPEE